MDLALQKFSKIHDRALARKGSDANLNALLPTIKSKSALSRIPDHRYLSQMTRCVFQAGFVWRVVNQKWDDFETVFFSFSPEKMIRLSPEQLEGFGKDKRIIRNMQKILSVPKNAQFILDEAHNHGSFAKLISHWPLNELHTLFALLKSKGTRLGGMTGPRVLRSQGKDTYLLTSDVVHCLQKAGLEIANNPGSKRDQLLIQQAFNHWHEETGFDYAKLSLICACSAGENYAMDKLIR